MMKWVLHYSKVLFNIICHPKRESYWLYSKYGTRLARICRNKIVFSSWNGVGYMCNPRYITEEILRQKKKWKIVWILDKTKRKNIPKGIKVVSPNSIASLREMATAKFVVSNVRNWNTPKKKKEQVFIQTWHGGMGFKCVERAVADKLSEEYLKVAKLDGSQCDAILSNCAFLTKEYRTNFWLNDNTQILEYGLPRNDLLFNKKYVQKVYSEVREKYRFQPNQKIILYMPTFRRDQSLDGYIMNYEGLIHSMELRFGGNFAVIVRMHPNALKLASSIDYGAKVVNGTDYLDVQELYMAADFLVSDYSSAVFDFALQRKPVFLCLLDFQKYQEERGLNEVFYKCPFPRSYSCKELMEQILEFDEEKYWFDFETFKEEWKPCDDGYASQRVVEWIEKKMEE